MIVLGVASQHDAGAAIHPFSFPRPPKGGEGVGGGGAERCVSTLTRTLALPGGAGEEAVGEA